MSDGDDLGGLLRREANSHRVADGRAGVDRHMAVLKARRKRRRAIGSGGLLAVVVLVAGLAVASRPTDQGRTVRANGPTGSGAAPNILALTERGNLVEYNTIGVLLRTIAPANEISHCYTTPCPPVSEEFPVTQAWLGFDPATQSALVAATPDGDIVAYPLDGSGPHVVARGSTPTVSRDGSKLATTTFDTQLGGPTLSVTDLVTGQVTSWALPASAIAQSAGLSNPASVTRAAASDVSWAPDSRHLAVTFGITFGYNSTDTSAANINEVVILDTAKPLTATNPRSLGPQAKTIRDLREEGTAKGWSDATWDGTTNTVVVLNSQTGNTQDLANGAPVELEHIDVATGAVLATTTLVQPADRVPPVGGSVSGPAQIFAIDPSGREALILGSGPARLELWHVGTGPGYTIIANNIEHATWLEPIQP